MKKDKYKLVTYTSTLPNMVMEDVAHYASLKSISKNKVIETALTHFFEEQKRKEYEESWLSMHNDPTVKETAEWGMGEYSKMINKYEKD